MLVLQCSLEDGVLPVGAQAEQRGVAVLCVGRTFALGHKVVVVLCKLAQVHHVEAFGLAVPCHHTVVAELGVARLSALGGDEHHAVGTLCTVDGGGRGVFQDLHADDVGRVDGRKGRDGRNGTVAQGIAQAVGGTRRPLALHDHAVNNVQRFGIGVDGGGATHTDGRRGAWGTRRLGGLHTGGTSLQRLVERGDDRTFHLRFVHRDRCTGKVRLLHRSVADYNNFFEQLIVALHLHIHSLASGNLDLLVLHADVGEQQCCVGARNLD